MQPDPQSCTVLPERRASSGVDKNNTVIIRRSGGQFKICDPGHHDMMTPSLSFTDGTLCRLTAGISVPAVGLILRDSDGMCFPECLSGIFP